MSKRTRDPSVKNSDGRKTLQIDELQLKRCRILPAISNPSITVRFPSVSGTLLTSADTLSNMTLQNPIISGTVKASYAPITLTSPWNIYGDSIVVGSGVVTIETFAYRVNKSLGLTYNNFGVSGYICADVCRIVYENKSEASTMFFVGTNDIRKAFENNVSTMLDSTLSQSVRCLENAILYQSLNSINNIVNARSATTVGTWTNTGAYSILGKSTTDNISATVSLSTVVTGRFVIVAFTQPNAGRSSTYGGEQFTINITNCVMNGDGGLGTLNLTALRNGGNMIGGVATNWGLFAWVYDTGVVGGSHTVTVTYEKTPRTDSFYVDWFGGFDPSPALANKVIVCGVPPWNYRLDQLGDAAAVYQTDTRRQQFNNHVKEVCRRARVTYGLPVYYVEPTELNMALMNADGLHPNTFGHKNIADRIVDVLTNGEKNFINQ